MKVVEYEKRGDGKVVGRFRVPEETAIEIDKHFDQRQVAHGNCKPVVVWGMAHESAYEARIKRLGAKPIMEAYFPSSRAASSHFGYGWDAVGQALGRAKRKGQDMAIVAGVLVRWADEAPGLN